MSEFQLTVLGTASQVPTRQRNQGAYFLRWGEQGILLDPGEGTQRQMIRAGVSASGITKILITHFHGDHSLGLPGVIQRLSLDRVNHTVEVYYPASGQVYYDCLREASIYYQAAKLKEYPIAKPGIIFANDKMTIKTERLDHTVETWGYRICERESCTMLPSKLKAAGLSGSDVGKLKKNGEITVNGRTIHLEKVSRKKSGRSFAFIMDTRTCQAAINLARGVDLLVCESTYLSDRARAAKEYGHLTAADAAITAKKAGAKKLVLTHFSQRYLSTVPFLEEAHAIHPDVLTVKDGDRIVVSGHQRMLQ